MFSFGEIAKTTRVDNVRNRQRGENVASVKNRRLAAQMTKRMGGIKEEPPAKGTVKSRLTIPIANRLGTKRGGSLQGRGGVRTRGGGRGGSVTSRIQRGASQTRGRGGSATRGRGGSATRGRGISRGGRSARGGRGALRGSRGGQTTRGRGRPNNQRGRAGTRGGRGRGRGLNKKPPTKEQLDTELDKYMSKTKSVLNSQLDEYMKGSD